MANVTGLYKSNLSGKYIQFVLNENRIVVQEPEGKKSPIDFLLDDSYPIWLLRHSLGKDMSEEDYSHLKEEDYLTENRSKVLSLHQKSGNLRDLFYHGLKVPTSDEQYSHAVGPIHAGIIEPGHFRFVVEGESIRHLSIRLGFQHRGIIKQMLQSKPERILALSETISGDSSVAYALAFSSMMENGLGIQIPSNVRIFRSLLLELERVAIHIGDLGGLAEDIGYYPLYGVCVTDRGAALGLMETWIGNRFGKGGIRPGGCRTNQRISPEDAKNAFYALKKVFYKNIEPQILRALSDSTIKERLQGCANISRDSVIKHGFVGPCARSAGVPIDLRTQQLEFPDWTPLSVQDDHINFGGDAWARFYLRYQEIKQSLLWMEAQIEKLDWNSLWSKEQIGATLLEIKLKQGLYFEAVEGWRGIILTCIEVDANGKITDIYVRDPSVLNWHALELAVRGELIGDFPLNNKSFNLSYVGFDL
ncbi:hypothetical protein LPTSP4_13880 [Leptospira ryugenii]|uniref:NADH-quinone oxidoreductase subunit D domain-containing protein n=1 Tax=Leptospira ryugenii TaxID=1917863 RepID=A0A2P2DZ11_9LEPT|nr:hydrogenase-4 subunit E [Leptospira ryugenii]GBF49868.1 hypothetical protein LPTSP4_13880 [Leptospira ryugenii]